MLVARNRVGAFQSFIVVPVFCRNSISIAFKESQSHLHQEVALVGALWIREPRPTFDMTTKMKGLLKGLRYISQIFESADEKEPEMQIGLPTDVKHVAHIGWDGPSVSSPSWMNEFNPAPELSSAPVGRNQGSAKHDLPKHSRRHQSSSATVNSSSRESALNSPTRGSPTAPKQSRRRKTKATSGARGSPGPGTKGSPGGGSKGGGSTRPRPKPQTTSTYVSPFSDPGVSTFSDPGISPGSPINNDPTSAIRGLQLHEKRGDRLF